MNRRAFLKNYVLASSGLFVPRIMRGQAHTFFDPQTYRGPVPTPGSPGPLAYWKLDDPDLPMIDSVAGNYGLQAIDTTTRGISGGLIRKFVRSTLYSGFYATGTAAADFAAGAGVSFCCSGWYQVVDSPNEYWCYKWTGTNTEWHMGPSTATADPRLTVSDLGGSPVSVTATAALTTWTHIAFGFDALAGVIWIQVNGGTRYTQACSGVRASNGALFLGGGGAGGLGVATGYDEVGFWKRSLSNDEVLSLYNGGIGLPYPFSTSWGNATALSWANQVAVNGGAAPAAATVTALATFADACATAGFAAKLIAVNCFVPDNLIASITPLLANQGNGLWTNNNFLAGDLSTSGLKGNASTKYLETGLNLSTFLSATALPWGGVTIYSPDAGTSTSGVEIGAVNTSNSSSDLYLGANAAGNSYAIFGGVGPAVADVGAGYYSMDRVSNSSLLFYRANSGLAHNQAGSSGSAASALLNSLSYVFAVRNTATGLPSSYSNKTLNLVAVHYPLTATESANFYNAIQALRTTFGGAV